MMGLLCRRSSVFYTLGFLILITNTSFAVTSSLEEKELGSSTSSTTNASQASPSNPSSSGTVQIPVQDIEIESPRSLTRYKFLIGQQTLEGTSKYITDGAISADSFDPSTGLMLEVEYPESWLMNRPTWGQFSYALFNREAETPLGTDDNINVNSLAFAFGTSFKYDLPIGAQVRLQPGLGQYLISQASDSGLANESMTGGFLMTSITLTRDENNNDAVGPMLRYTKRWFQSTEQLTFSDSEVYLGIYYRGL